MKKFVYYTKVLTNTFVLVHEFSRHPLHVQRQTACDDPQGCRYDSSRYHVDILSSFKS